MNYHITSLILSYPLFVPKFSNSAACYQYNKGTQTFVDANESKFSDHSICMMWILWGSYMGCSSVLHNCKWTIQETRVPNFQNSKGHKPQPLVSIYKPLVQFSCLSVLALFSHFSFHIQSSLQHMSHWDQ